MLYTRVFVCSRYHLIGCAPMGNVSTKVSSLPGHLKKPPNNVKAASQKFTHEERSILEKLFADLARRSPGKTMDKTTFLTFFSSLVRAKCSNNMAFNTNL